jgi:hypothetical protein
MHALLRTAGDRMFDTRAWRGLAVVGDDGIEPRWAAIDLPPQAIPPKPSKFKLCLILLVSAEGLEPSTP